MGESKLLKNYVSPIDKFIQQFDSEHPQLSKSQRQEIAKHNRVFSLRDVADRPEEKMLPDDF